MFQLVQLIADAIPGAVLRFDHVPPAPGVEQLWKLTLYLSGKGGDAWEGSAASAGDVTARAAAFVATLNETATTDGDGKKTFQPALALERLGKVTTAAERGE